MQLKPAMLHIPTAIAEYVDLVPGLRPLVHNHHIETPLSASAVDKLFKLATLVESSFTESGENKAAASKLKIQAVLMSSGKGRKEPTDVKRRGVTCQVYPPMSLAMPSAHLSGVTCVTHVRTTSVRMSFACTTTTSTSLTLTLGSDVSVAK